MNEYLILKYLHLLAFVYWLGGDLGTFLASRYVIKDDISPEARATALKVMMACDQAPKSSMPLILPLGLQMTQFLGLTSLPTWLMVLIWLVALVWTFNVQFLYFSQSPDAKARVTRLDYAIRIAVIGVIIGFCGLALVQGGWIGAQWVITKLLIFASMVAAGLIVRVRIKPFVAAFGQMMSSGATPELNQTMRSSLGQVRPYVWYIWAGLFVNAALGLRLL